MKKITKKPLSQRITQYGAMSLAIAGVADAAGQVQYTDVEPDFVAVDAGDNFVIDFLDDGVDEVAVLRGETGGGTPFTTVRNQVSTDAPVLTGQIVGQLTGGFTYALNLDEDDMIDADTGTFGANGSLCYLDGFAGTFCGENGATPDGFVGVSFEFAGNTHYGWIGLEGVSGSGYTVTGYAFELTPETAIAAGDQGELSLEDNKIEGLSTFVDSNVFNVRANTPIENVTIHNLTGQKVLSQNPAELSSSLDMRNLSTGVYIATVTVESKRQAIKIVKK